MSDANQHSGSYLAAEGETWVTMAHYEELLAERDRLFEQLETLRGDYDEQVRLVMRLGEQLEVLQRVADAARYQVQHYAGDTTVTLISAIDHLNASYPQYEDHPSRVGEAP